MALTSAGGCASDDPKAPTREHFQAAIARSFETDPTRAKVCTNGQFPTSMQAATRAVDADALPYDAVVLAQANALAAAGALTKQTGMSKARTGAYPYRETLVPTVRFAAAPGAAAKGVVRQADSGSRSFGNVPDVVQVRLCYATIAIDHVDNFTEPADAFGQHVSEVTYYAKIASIQPWANDPHVGAAFPEIRKELATLPTAPQKAAVTLTDRGWQISQ